MNLSPSQQKRLRALFHRRQEAIAADWFQAIASAGRAPDELHDRLRSLVDRIMHIMLADTFDEPSAQAIGAALIDLGAQPDTLGETQALLGRGLMADLPVPLVFQLQPRLGMMLGAIATGFFAGARAAMLAEHNAIRKTLASELAEHIATVQHNAAVFRSMFEDAAIGMAFVAPDGQFMRANAALCAMLGYTEAELMRLDVDAITHPDDRAADRANMERLLRGEGTTFQMEKRYVHKQGHVVWGLLSVSLAFDERGLPLHFVSQVQNITRRKREERQNAIFGRLGHDLSRAKYATEAAQLIAAAADDLLGWDAFSLVLYEPDSDRVHVVLNVDMIDGRRVEVPELGYGHGPSPIARRVLAEGPLLILPDTPSLDIDGALPFGDTNRPSAALMFVPIHSGHPPIGVLSIQSYTPHAYTADDLELLHTLANTCGGALDRIRATARLQRSEARYRAVVEQQTELLCRSLPDGTLTFVNDAYCRFFGKQADELIGTNYQTLMPPDAHDGITQSIASLTPDRPVVTYENLERSTDGTVRWLQWTDRGIFDDQGRLIEVQSVGRDITERMLAEARLRESEATNRALLAALPDVLYHIRRDGTILDIKASDKHPNRAPGLFDAIGKRVSDVLPSEQAAEALNNIEQAFRAGTVQTFEYQISINGTLHEREARIAVCALDEVLVLVRDITERKHAEDALRRSEAANRALLNTIPDMIFRFDSAGTYLDFRGQQDQLLAPLDAFLGKTLDDVLPPALAQQAKHHLRRALMTDEPQIFEYEVTIDGHRRVEEARMVRYADNQVLSIVREISARKAAEAARMQAHKLESLGNLSAGIAHEFNNLLMVMLGNAELAQLDLPPDNPARSNITQIELAARRASQLTRQMLTYAGKERVATQPVAIPQLLADLRSTIGKRVPPRVRLQYDVQSEMPEVAADPVQLGQVVLHLLANAVDALDNAEGTITIASGSMELGEIEMRELKLQHQLAVGCFAFVEVADTGHGMDADTQARMFDPFFTTKSSGSGLSLAAVQGIVLSHDGAIHVTSVLGKGTAVRVLLPAIPANADHGSNGASAPDALAQRTVVLVVDDDPRVRSLTTRLLTRLHCGSVEASGGAEAVQMFEADPRLFDLVLLDLTMPEMNGVATFHALRAIRHDARIVLMSGYGEQHAATDLLNRGLAGFLQKPFMLEELKRMLDEVVVTRQPEH